MSDPVVTEGLGLKPLTELHFPFSGPSSFSFFHVSAEQNSACHIIGFSLALTQIHPSQTSFRWSRPIICKQNSLHSVALEFHPPSNENVGWADLFFFFNYYSLPLITWSNHKDYFPLFCHEVYICGSFKAVLMTQSPPPVWSLTNTCEINGNT